MRPIHKGDWPLTRTGRRRVFNNWTRATPFLIRNTGRYCHFCEMFITNAPAVEHIKPKERFPGLSNNWENFLLICDYCNSRKGADVPAEPIATEYYWPHLHNTLMVFEHVLAGTIQPNSIYITEKNRIDRANRTINLYGLNKTTDSAGGRDIRLELRLTALKKAIDRKLEYLEGKATLQAIIDMATATGFFSVWLKVFDDIPLVRRALIDCAEFHLGTANSFNVNYELQDRPGNEI